MEVTLGYKQTEAGVIPEDWCIRTVFEIAGYQKVRFDDGDWIEAEHISNDGYRIAQTGNIGIGKFIEKEAKKYIHESSFEKLNCKELIPGDLLICRLAEPAGRACILPDLGETKVVTAVDVTIFRPSEVNADRRYLVQYFSTPQWFESVLEQVGGTTHKRISRSALGNIKVPLPCDLDEQHAIATALSDMDALLDGLDCLIAKKRAIKQATMQQLLTGQTRLPGFSGEWKIKPLGELCSLRSGESITSEDIDETSEFPCYGGNGLRGYTNDYTHDGDYVLIGRQGALCGNVVAASGKFFASEHALIVTSTPEVATKWLYYILSEANLNQYSESSAQPGLSATKLLRLEFNAPPAKEEQTAIANVLTDMDTEITALETRRAKTLALKQAMMQELLTGRTRLVMPDAKPVGEVAAQTEGRKANVHFLRSVLAAEIIDQLHDQPTFGHVKFEKMMFLAEHLCEVDTGSTYHRKAAGPYDNRALRSIDSQLQKQQWFEARKQEGRYQYVPLAKRGGHKPYFERHFSGIGETLEKILSAFKTAKTEQCEIVATLLAAWSDLLSEKGTVSDETIVHEVLHNWHEAKQRIPEDRWLMALGWMREKGFVPKGVTLP
ncbi:restriction endonuclease subunit S [Alcaligenes nematophilus]|uniref:restriction endonuclease subunit S n=1 Tax=Alcaligenes TaxID=507 RepID=UPI001CF68662|nr:restriction endonuclease subunit S [Alcaligenes sp. 13f]MCB4320815.1 restriction endonuclease subunit S [Alcaligenes sp. 13f]